jgi:hypothetical protein
MKMACCGRLEWLMEDLFGDWIDLYRLFLYENWSLVA